MVVVLMIVVILRADHARTRCPILNPKVDQVDLWFLRYQELCLLAELLEKHWVTKVTGFFDAETIKTVFSLSEEDRKIYQTVKNAVMTR